MNPALPLTAGSLTAAALDAAAAVARLLPSTTPLTATPAEPGALPGPDDVAVVASFVGSVSADLVIIAEEAVREALLAAADAGAPVALADALRPALEAACAELGAGVLDAASTAPASQAVASDAHLFALVHEGVAHAWFALRVRAEPVPAREAGVPTQRAGLHVLYDVEMTLTAELGRTRLPVRQVLELTPGAVLELDRTAGSPADVMVNGRLIARGEVVVVDEEYGIRITQIVAGPDGLA